MRGIIPVPFADGLPFGNFPYKADSCVVSLITATNSLVTLLYFPFCAFPPHLVSISQTLGTCHILENILSCGYSRLSGISRYESAAAIQVGKGPRVAGTLRVTCCSALQPACAVLCSRSGGGYLNGVESSFFFCCAGVYSV